ncbi:MAG: hypothetical protein IPP78_07860 [Holophagaceae bacterium]|nr:hypothetical protein [Holophagaceae bacterium]
MSIEAMTPEQREMAIQAIETDPLNLPDDVAAMVRQSAALSELRIHWLALQDPDINTAVTTAPAGYFQALPGRMLRKLPVKVAARHRLHPALWAAAAVLMLTIGVGGFWAGKANRTPWVEAKTQDLEPAKDLPLADAPFQESDDVLVQIQNLSPEEIQRIADKVKKSQ